MRYVVLVVVGIVLVPIMIMSGLVAATAILAEWFSFNLLDFSDIGILDWLAGGPGAGANSFENYVTFMISGVLAAACFGGLAALWSWAQESNRPGTSSDATR